ncbi:efflux transporter outer membrane subunit [Caballeronia sordidicola]|uniref:Outer membrane component of tripartite multidrug resistance system n=1 Tax=Caballeronia sordidicola TaxID=196367 RepID=A0A226WM79_CABSO|nr:efflux transporter outer membrane subunit [Caballeronia sordidicola]OXC72304.1 Outer membrane component of tripartite multidrug resistance system [Caballeronia sordidicola]
MSKRLIPLLFSMLAGACSVGPDFTPPDAQAPDNWHDLQRVQNPPDDMRFPHASMPSLVATNADPDPRWWRQFNDTTLDSLVDRAAAGNLDLKSAVLRIAAAREQAVVSGAQGLPQLSANASYKREQLGLKGLLQSQGVYDKVNALGPNSASVTGALNSLTAPVSLFQDGFDASWELDLFGRVRRSVESANAQTESAIENRNDALVSLEAEVAQTYSQLRGAQLLKRITLAEIDSEQQILDLTREQARVGLTSQSDVESATAQVGSLQAQLPQFDAQIAQAMNGLAVLTGSAPGALDEELEAPGAVPPVPPSVPVGLPSTLARRRPDIRRAESDLHAATAEIGVAVAQMYPDVSLTGTIGTRATQAKYLAHWSSLFWTAGPSISLPIFEGGALRANVRIAKAQAGQAALQYRSTVLKALQDVDNALVSYRTDQDRREALTRTVEANRISLQLATDSYRKGLVSFITVLDAERQLAGAREQLAQSTVSVTTDLIAVYKALGGGWQGAPEAADS